MKPDVLTNEIRVIVEMMGIHVKEVQYYYDNDIEVTLLSLRLSGNDVPLLHDENREGLRALSLYLKKFLEKKYHFYKDIILDINGEEIEFIQYTKDKAELAFERVDYFDKPYEFGYLNAYERMIVHSYLKKYKNMVTESQGEGKERRLIVKKRG